MSKYFKTEIKPRGPRTSKAQYETYVKFLEDNPKFSRNILSNSYTVEKRDSDWARLVELLNSSQGANKNPKQWHESFHDWRKKISVRYRRATTTNGPEMYPKAGELTELDIRALKALGKWTDENTYKIHPELHYNDNKDNDNDNTNYEDEGDDDYSYHSDQFDFIETGPKMEPVEDPIVIYPENPKKRKHDDEPKRQQSPPPPPESSKHSKIVEENTKAIRNHTAALMALADSITSLTSTIRSYMYSKNSD